MRCIMKKRKLSSLLFFILALMYFNIILLSSCGYGNEMVSSGDLSNNKLHDDGIQATNNIINDKDKSSLLTFYEEFVKSLYEDDFTNMKSFVYDGKLRFIYISREARICTSTYELPVERLSVKNGALFQHCDEVEQKEVEVPIKAFMFKEGSYPFFIESIDTIKGMDQLNWTENDSLYFDDNADSIFSQLICCKSKTSENDLDSKKWVFAKISTDTFLLFNSSIIDTNQIGNGQTLFIVKNLNLQNKILAVLVLE